MMRLPVLMALAMAALPAFAQTASDGEAAGRPAFQVEAFASDDADDTTLQRVALGFDWAFRDATHYRGVQLERTRIRPLGERATEDTRAYLAWADGAAALQWQVRAGTDGHALLGSANLMREAPLRQ